MTFESILADWNTKISAFVVIAVPYLRFSYHFHPRGESATFLLATMITSTEKSTQCIACHYLLLQQIIASTRNQGINTTPTHQQKRRIALVATKKLRDFAPTKASIGWVLTLGKQFTKSLKSFLSTVECNRGPSRARLVCMESQELILCSPNEDFQNRKNVLDRLVEHFFK